MQEDKKVYQKLLEKGTITKEQYNALVLGKITVGIGYNDIRETIKNDTELIRDDINNLTKVKPTEKFAGVYTDAEYVKDGIHDGQWIIKKRENTESSSYEALYTHEDDIQIYDAKNADDTLLIMMKRMEQAIGKNRLPYMKGEKTQKSQKIINEIANEYQINPENTKIVATNRIAIIYSKENGSIKICDIFSSPIKANLKNEQKKKAEEHLKYQMKKALRQIKEENLNFDVSSLTEEQKDLIQSIIKEIQRENER